jgi:hypothetical protein
MTLTEFAPLLGDFSDFFGAIAVVITLIYLAIQIKHNTQSGQIAAAQSFAEVDNGFVGVINLSGELPEVLHKGAKGLSELEGGDTIRFMAFHDQVFVSIYAAYLQWQAGTLDERLWRTFKAALIDLLDQPGQKDWWGLRRHWFDDEFQEYVDRTVESEGGKPMHPSAFSG